MANCSNCEMPMENESEQCSCNNELCFHCCECDTDCECACSEKE